MATSTHPCGGQVQVRSAKPWGPRLNLELGDHGGIAWARGLAVTVDLADVRGFPWRKADPRHTIKSQFVFPAQPGNGPAPMSDRAALDQYCPGGCPPAPSDHEPVHLLLKEECMPDFVGVVNQGIARPEDSYV